LELTNYNFSLVATIVPNDFWDELHPRIKFRFLESFQDKRAESWVYAWVKVRNNERSIIYIGKAGRTLKQRFGGHEGGGRPSPQGSGKGRKNSKNLTELLNQGYTIEVWARQAETIELFGEQVSLVSTEEEALIQKFKKIYQLWNS